MKPVYANAFGIQKTQHSSGALLEVTLDISHKYMETATTVTSNGSLENVSTPAIETVASVVMTPANAMALRNLLNKTLGDLAPGEGN